jgi:spermidine synthase
VETVWSPLSVLTAVSSSFIRETPGQISGYPMDELGELPEQIALYFDADAVTPVHRFDGSTEPFAFLDHVTSALPYQVLERPRTLVIGAGGGTEVLSALRHGASHVTAVELDPNVVRLVEGPLREFSGGLYSRPDVRSVVAEGRGWLEANASERFDLIQISLLDSFNASAAGVRALSESYLYTVEAADLYLDRLSAEGVLAITRWLRSPPRDAIKMFATLVEAGERAGLDDLGRHVALVRSWNTATLLLSHSPLSAEQVQAIRDWTGSRGFDLGWLTGVDPGEVNRFTVLDDPTYWEAARRILASEPGAREDFYDDYPFHVRPATDDRPHFFRFFKWTSMPWLVESVRQRWTTVVEWGYLVLLGTALQAAAAALLIVILPLAIVFWLGERRTRSGDGGEEDARAPSPGRVILYFVALGLAYLFLEIAFIQKLMLFLYHPVYAVAVVLSAFLIFSGLGSALSNRYVGGPVGRARSRASSASRLSRTIGGRKDTPRRLVGLSVLLITVLMLGYVVLLPRLFSAGGGWPDLARIVASLMVLAPVAFLMGIPFPTGLQVVSRYRQPLVPWAWAVNGAASVVAPPLAVLAAIHWGFTVVVGLAVALYVGAYATLARQLQA